MKKLRQRLFKKNHEITNQNLLEGVATSVTDFLCKPFRRNRVQSAISNDEGEIRLTVFATRT